jgi:hypothetical protein
MTENAAVMLLPTEPGLRIESEAYMRAIRDQLGLSEVQHPLTCRCHVKAQAKEKNKDKVLRPQQLLPNDRASMVHLATCKHLGGGIHTHDTVLEFLRILLASLPGVVSRHEVWRLLKHLRADLVVWLPDKIRALILDLSITNPLCPTYLQQAAASTLAAARLRDDAKEKKWTAPSEAQGYDFRPMSLEYTGGMSKIFERTLRQWANALNSLQPYQPVNWAAPTRLAYWQQRISVLLIRSHDRAIQNLLKALSKEQATHSTSTPPPAPLLPPAPGA